MRFFCLTLLATAVLTSVGSAQPPAAAPTPKTDKEKVSYSIGYDIGKKIGKDFKANGIDLDPALFAQAIKEGLLAAKPALTDEEMKKVRDDFQKEMIANAPKRAAEASAKAKKEGETFLAENGKKPGVITTKSGLQYKVVKEGIGATPKTTDIVKTHYHGTLLDGTVFDSSVERNDPATFPVNRVIPGWTEALQLMKVGQKCQLYIPSELAYGEDGTQDGAIAPNSTLIFDIELLSIEKPKSGLPEGLPKLEEK